MRTMRTTWAMGAVFGAALVTGCSAQNGGDDVATSTDEPLVAAPFFAGDTANHATFAADVSVWESPLAQSQMDCFWDSGIRHVIVGTQDATVAQQQLAMAVSRGMTVDAYVFLYWNQDVAAQVEAAFAMVKDFPIGTMWLDIEEEQGAANLGAGKLTAAIQAGLDTCKMHGTGCGIYTSPGFWKSYVSNTSAFTSTPLWYALYNKKRSLSDWSTEHFGGWTAPVGKQFQTAPLCGVGGADWDILQVSATPALTVDRSLPPDTGLPPPAPGGLFPGDGSVDLLGYVKLMSATIPRATNYQLALDRWTGTTWIPYYTWTSANAYVKASLPTAASVYRFRARAENAHGWGAWSDYSTFDYGHYTGTRPTGSSAPPAPTTSSTSAPPAPSTSSTPPAPATPPPPGVPGSLSPSGGAVVTTSGVTVSCGAIAGATEYQFAIESSSASGFVPYFTYAPASPSQTFYPATRGIDYRFRARAMLSGAWGDWSDYASFHVN